MYEGDIAEFYLKLDNDVLIKFPFLHVDHPLHRYYEFVKLNTKKRLITKYPKIIPSPLKDLFQYVTDLENTKVINNEIKSKKLKEKQIEHVKNKKGNKQILMKQKENQSYSSLFMRYMQSDDEKSNSTVENDKNEEHNEDTLSNESMMEIDNIIKKLKDKKDKSSMQTARFYLQCIEKLKFLQYGTKQYKYFVQKLLYDQNRLNVNNSDIKSTDFLEFLLKTDEHKKSLDNVINEDIYEQQNSHETETERDDLQTMQDYRRERAKLILHGFKNK
ncbi:hypothetical protein PFAG_01473 [Plasmodium falciparum Santa Lucia]|uniref:SURP motif domain-containing protein n=2 Tax=Plasmodium falciparum TaxID=5833 RepID=A0A024VBK3_PLAFA|nr:hypothetical protein PFFVO_01500 [Plasmodium falciparum Vietnam Oak-Knoll (FVO)]EUT89320.1 hypothetical protein PFAG_01473 [Plasmodium falciparum Santa Lucia]